MGNQRLSPEFKDEAVRQFIERGYSSPHGIGWMSGCSGFAWDYVNGREDLVKEIGPQLWISGRMNDS